MTALEEARKRLQQYTHAAGLWGAHSNKLLDLLILEVRREERDRAAKVVQRSTLDPEGQDFCRRRGIIEILLKDPPHET